MRKTFFIFAAALAIAVTGCQKEQNPVFETGSSDRMNEYLDDVHTLLQSYQYGWILEYYPGSQYAGSTFALTFTSQMVTAIHESDPSKSATSTYILTTDDGPVLSFDTYNTILHYYATPSASKYQAMGGDFEFAILSYSADEIVLRGRRSRNICTLRPLLIAGDYYLDDVNYMADKISLAAVSVTIDGVDMMGYLDSGSRTLSIGPKDAEESSLASFRYVVTDKGIRFSTPVTVGSAKFVSWDYDKAAERFTSGEYVFTKAIPKGWVSYDDYLGDYKLYYDNGEESLNVKLVQDVKGSTFIMKGLYSSHDVYLGYNGGRGRLTWVRQTVGASGSAEIVLCPWDSNAGYLTWVEGVGIYGYVTDNSDVPNNFTVEFADNGVWENYFANGWISYSINGDSRSPASGSYLFANGDYRLPGDITLVRSSN